MKNEMQVAKKWIKQLDKLKKQIEKDYWVNRTAKDFDFSSDIMNTVSEQMYSISNLVNNTSNLCRIYLNSREDEEVQGARRS